MPGPPDGHPGLLGVEGKPPGRGSSLCLRASLGLRVQNLHRNKNIFLIRVVYGFFIFKHRVYVVFHF